MGTNLSLSARTGKQCQFLLLYVKAPYLHHWQEFHLTFWESLLFSGRPQENGSPDSHVHIDILICKPLHVPDTCLLFASRLGVGCRHFCWVWDPECPGVPPVEVLLNHGLGRPCCFLKHHPEGKGLHMAPRPSWPLSMASGTQQVFYPLNCSGAWNLTSALGCICF